MEPMAMEEWESEKVDALIKALSDAVNALRQEVTELRTRVEVLEAMPSVPEYIKMKRFVKAFNPDEPIDF